jgi:hypothetical protein
MLRRGEKPQSVCFAAVDVTRSVGLLVQNRQASWIDQITWNHMPQVR